MSGILRNRSLRITTNMCQLSSFKDSVNILLSFLNKRGCYRTGPKAPVGTYPSEPLLYHSKTNLNYMSINSLSSSFKDSVISLSFPK